MSKVIQLLKKLFDDRFIEADSTTISEPSEGMSRVLYRGNGIPDDDMLVCRLDQDRNPQVKDLFPYLRKSGVSGGLKGMRRICDYAVFVDYSGVLYVLLVELKKGDDSPQEQLNLTEPLISFIFERAKILNHFVGSYEIRKVGISDVSDKRRTSYRGDIVYENGYTKLYSGKKVYLLRLLH